MKLPFRSVPGGGLGRRVVPAAVAALLLAAPALSAQAKPPLTVDDYGPWTRITGVEVSPDGAWMTYAYEPLDGEDTLFVRALDREPDEPGAVHAVPRGSGAAFSRDSRRVAYLVAPPEEEGSSRNGGGDRPRTLVLRDLASGDSVTFVDVAGHDFPENTDVLLVRKRGPGDDADHEGADLVVHDLGTGLSLNLGNVASYAVNEPGTHLAWLVDAADDAGNGLYLLELGTGRIQPLDTDAATYADLAWSDDGTSLAALRGTTPEGEAERENVLLVVPEVEEGRLLRLDPTAGDVPGFPGGFVLSERGSVAWSEDGRRLFVGIKEQRPEVEEDEEAADVDVWHWADEEVQSVQQVRARRNRDRTWASVVNLEDGRLTFVRLADETLETVSPAGPSPYGVGRDPTPYEDEISWGGSDADYYRVDLDTGERTVMAEEVGRQMGTSPDGGWWLFLRDEEVIAREIASGREVNLTAATGIDFVDRLDDHPYELPVYGVEGWVGDDDGGARSVVLEHRYDLYDVPLDGGAARSLTGGVGDRERIRFGLTELRDDDEAWLDLDGALLYTAYGDRTKKSGYWRGEAGAEPEPLFWVDEAVGRPVVAEEADRMAFTRETFVRFPDWWVSDTDFGSPRRVTDANPQQADFAWSPGRVLIDYVDDRGNELQATLALPAGYEEGRRYPMLVYFYETMSERHHRYQGPRYDDRPHAATYASNGYLFLQPDIVYTEGEPGTSALDDLTAAVEKVVEMGYADPERIGLQGHSWGGYQSSFVVTQTDIFAAVVTGAPPTNLVSFYNTLYKSSGTVQQGITEVGQVRMGTTPFEDFDQFVSQSPIHHTANISTPFMILHGTDDGAVDWMQGLEFYNMARRQGKEVILLSYPGEPHHLARRPNQIDFQIRMMQYFDHHVRGRPAAKWMVEGVDFLEKEIADVREMVDGSVWGKPAVADGEASGAGG